MATRTTPASGVKLIAVTGGPCGGKTEFIKRVHLWLSRHGLRVAVAPEAATHLMRAGYRPHQEDFQRRVLQLILENEEAYRSGTKAGLVDVLICDRGALDAIAYIGRERFEAVAASLGTSIAQLRQRYTSVVHLVTAAEGAKAFYNLDNEARTETPEQARELDRQTRKAWDGHVHHHVIGNESDFSTKMKRALHALGRVLHMPVPIEIERKFVFTYGLDPGWFRRYDPVVVPTLQAYLPVDEEGFIPRIRRQQREGAYSYILERKRETGVAGVREEEPRPLTKEEFEELMRQRDPTLGIIEKDRHVFFLPDRHRAELDQFHGPLEGLWLLEVELRERGEEILFPPSWGSFLLEVTEKPEFGNYELARQVHKLSGAA